MVDALTRLHAALVPGGVLVDTQPVSLRLPVALDGELEDDVWLEMVAAVDAEIDKTPAAGLFALRHEERHVAVHEFGSGAECLEWRRVGREPQSPRTCRTPRARLRPVTVEQETRLRVLDRR